MLTQSDRAFPVARDTEGKKVSPSALMVPEGIETVKN